MDGNQLPWLPSHCCIISHDWYPLSLPDWWMSCYRGRPSYRVDDGNMHLGLGANSLHGFSTHTDELASHSGCIPSISEIGSWSSMQVFTEDERRKYWVIIALICTIISRRTRNSRQVRENGGNNQQNQFGSGDPWRGDKEEKWWVFLSVSLKYYLTKQQLSSVSALGL